MIASCTRGAVANLDAVLGDLTKWSHGYKSCPEYPCHCGLCKVRRLAEAPDGAGYIKAEDVLPGRTSR